MKMGKDATPIESKIQGLFEDQLQSDIFAARCHDTGDQ